jgi:hypothetical protein
MDLWSGKSKKLQKFLIVVERDFERLDAPAVEGIFREVSLKGEIVQSIAEAITGSP